MHRSPPSYQLKACTIIHRHDLVETGTLLYFIHPATYFEGVISLYTNYWPNRVPFEVVVLNKACVARMASEVTCLLRSSTPSAAPD